MREEIINQLTEDRTCIATTIVDFYGLPPEQQAGWPGRAEAVKLKTTLEKARCMESAIQRQPEIALGGDARRFIPFDVMHEIEGLLFRDCEAFARGILREDLQPSLQFIRDQFPTPEDISDSSTASPSKRVLALMPNYRKQLLRIQAIREIGIEKMRAECPHFHDWLRRLEDEVR